MEGPLAERQSEGKAPSDDDILMSATKKRKVEDAAPGEQPSQERLETTDDAPKLAGGSEDASKPKRWGSNGIEREGGGPSVEGELSQAETSDPVEMRRMNVQLLELVHELEAQLMDSGKPVRKSQFSESVAASQQRLKSYKKRKQIANISQIEVARRKQGAMMPASTVSTFGHGVGSPSVWSQGVFSNLTAQGGTAGGQGLPPLWRTGEDTPVSELKQLAQQEGQKAQEEQAPLGDLEEKPASSGSGQGSKEKGEEVEGGREGSPSGGGEALAKLVSEKDDEIKRLQKELDAFNQQTEAAPEPKHQVAPPPTPKGPSGSPANQAGFDVTVNGLQARLTSAMEENLELQKSARKLETRIAALEGIISRRDATHAELVKKLEAAEERVAKQGSSREGPKSEVELREEVRHLRDAMEVGQGMEKELRRQSAEKDSRIAAAASIVEQLKQATEHLQEEKKVKEAEVLKLRRENKGLQAQILEAMRLLNAQEEAINGYQKRLRDQVPAGIEPPEAQAARSILEVAKEFNVKTIDKLKVELQKAKLVESLEAALQQSIKELGQLRKVPVELQKPPESNIYRVRELEAVLEREGAAMAKLERENAALKQEVTEVSKDKRKAKETETEVQLQKQLTTKQREVEDLSKDLQASYVQHSKVQRMLELLREANIGSVDKVRIMIKRHQQYADMDTKVRLLETENASLQRKLKRSHDSSAPDTSSPAAEPQKAWYRRDGKNDTSTGPDDQDDNSREDIPIASRKLSKMGSMDMEKLERPKAGGAAEGEGGERAPEAKEGVLSIFAGKAAETALEALMSRARAGLGEEPDEERLRELLKGAERVEELQQALAEQKHRADRLEAKLKKAKVDEKSSAGESQAIATMVRVLGIEKNDNESGVLAIEKALQAAAADREAMNRELELKREEVELMARRLQEISQKSSKIEEFHAASAEAAGEAASLQVKLMTSQSMVAQLQRRNRSLLMDAAAAQAVLEVLRGPYLRDVGQLQLFLERAIELSINEQR